VSEIHFTLSYLRFKKTRISLTRLSLYHSFCDLFTERKKTASTGELPLLGIMLAALRHIQDSTSELSTLRPFGKPRPFLFVEAWIVLGAVGVIYFIRVIGHKGQKSVRTAT
jgi:hypothetical protein